MAKELEMKILTDAAEFSRCLGKMRELCAQPGETYVQVNYYYDSPAFDLAANHSMLRVRRKKDSLRLQFKNKRSRTGTMLLCDELEARVPALPHTVNPARFFPGAPDCDCSLLGNLVTCRTDFDCPGAVVSFDENLYFGKRDFEIEIEGDREAIEALAAQLSPVGEAKKGNGKFSRFLSEYRRFYAAAKEEGSV